MRPVVLMLFACLAVSVSACGGTTHKTVVVNPPADSTTVVDENGRARVIEH